MTARQCSAAQARDRIAQLAPVGSTVVLLGDPAQPDRDGYGRLPRYLAVDGRDVQELLPG